MVSFVTVTMTAKVSITISAVCFNPIQRIASKGRWRAEITTAGVATYSASAEMAFSPFRRNQVGLAQRKANQYDRGQQQDLLRHTNKIFSHNL